MFADKAIVSLYELLVVCSLGWLFVICSGPSSSLGKCFHVFGRCTTVTFVPCFSVLEDQPTQEGVMRWLLLVDIAATAQD